MAPGPVYAGVLPGLPDQPTGPQDRGRINKMNDLKRSFKQATTLPSFI